MIIKLIISCVICLSAGLIGSFFSVSISSWYQSLNKPAFTPPSWLFGPVWTVLYILMGISAFLVWQKGFDNRSVKIALAIFLVQLVLNVIWTPLFFGLNSPLLALIDIVFMWLAILITIISFSSLSKTAALLLIPYILWVTFAAVLNLSIVFLNR